MTGDLYVQIIIKYQCTGNGINTKYGEYKLIIINVLVTPTKLN